MFQTFIFDAKLRFALFASLRTAIFCETKVNNKLVSFPARVKSQFVYLNRIRHRKYVPWFEVEMTNIAGMAKTQCRDELSRDYWCFSGSRAAPWCFHLFNPVHQAASFAMLHRNKAHRTARPIWSENVDEENKTHDIFVPWNGSQKNKLKRQTKLS